LILVLLLVAVAAFLTACCIASYRVLAGPTGPDRVIAADTLTSILTAGLGYLAIYYGADYLLDVALSLAILNFIGTLAIAKYLEGRPLGE